MYNVFLYLNSTHTNVEHEEVVGNIVSMYLNKIWSSHGCKVAFV